MTILAELQAKQHLTILMISHDIGVIAATCHTLALMYRGKLVEQTRVADFLAAPHHPYGAALLSCRPEIDRPDHQMVPIPGRLPPLEDTINGCDFHPRCQFASEICTTTPPALLGISARQNSASNAPPNA